MCCTARGPLSSPPLPSPPLFFLPVPGLTLRVHGGLASELLEHLGGTGQSITALADANVEAELLNAELAHRVLGLVLGLGGGLHTFGSKFSNLRHEPPLQSDPPILSQSIPL